MWQVVIRNSKTQQRLALFSFSKFEDAERLASMMQASVAALPSHSVEISVQWAFKEGQR